jgi:hypothetical protein
LNPRFTGSNLAQGYRLVRAIKICSMPSFGGEVKLSTQCHKILWHVKEPFEIGKRYFIG